MKKLLLAILVLVLTHQSIISQTWEDTVARIEKLFTRYKAGNPGAQLTISRSGNIIYSKAWGMADLEHQVPLTTSSPTEAGSVSKQFTTAAILLLEQEGKLSLDDDVRKYVPELPDYGTPITLRHMITHTSGLKDWGAIGSLAGWPRSTKTYNNDDALYIISRQKTLNHKPGDEFLYSNSNYNLMAVIVQRVSGKSLFDYSREKIFEPAGMRNTQWRADFRKIVPNRALAYSKSGNEYLTNMPNEYVYGNGGLITTTDDLVKWTAHYGRNKLGKGGLLDKQIRLASFNNGKPQFYAAGLFIQKFRGIDLWTHDGATAGYRANLDYFPSIDLAIAFLSNTSEFDRDTLDVPLEIRRIFLALPPQTNTTSSTSSYSLPADQLSQYEGWFRNMRTGAGTKIALKDGKLVTQSNTVLTPLSENVFSAGPSKVAFHPGKKELYMLNSSDDSTLFIRAENAVINEEALNSYAGEYYSEECECRFSLSVKNNQLILKQKPADNYVLNPTYKDGFEAPFGVIRFERNKKNKPQKLFVSMGRARNVEFEKVK